MSPAEDTNPRQYADNNGHHGLHIVVNADYGGAQDSLTVHGQYIAEKGAYAYDKCRFQPRLRGEGCIVNGCNVLEGEGQNTYCSVSEHPFVYSKDGILLYQGIEKSKVEGKGKLGKKTQNVASDVPNLVTDR